MGGGGSNAVLYTTAMEEKDFFPTRESNDPPAPEEAICLVSYEVTAILLAGDPKTRPGFWKAYRRELSLNQKTGYQNYHVNLCRPLLRSLQRKTDFPVFYKGLKLVSAGETDPLA